MKYYNDGADRVLALMKDTFGSQFKHYFNEEMFDIGEDFLPCMMVTSLGSEVDTGATGTDDIGERIQIIMVMSQKDDLGAPSDANLTGDRLRKMVFGQYPEGHAKEGQYVEESIMYALRTHITLGDATIANSADIQFTPNIRNTNQAAPLYTREAGVTITLTRLAIVPNRDNA